MRRIALTVAYDGTDWCGSQRQHNGRTIQGEIEGALEISLKAATSAIVGSYKRMDHGKT